MGESRCIAILAVFLTMVLLSPSVYAHEQEILNVILVEEEARPGNVSDSAFVEGNGIVFRMRDNTENASMQIRIDLNQDGVFNGSEDNVSVWLTRSCSLDENGSLIDKNCAVSHQIIFGNTSQGVYDYQIKRMIENSTSEVWNYSIQVWPDIHEEPGQPTVGDCFGAGCDEEHGLHGTYGPRWRRDEYEHGWALRRTGNPVPDPAYWPTASRPLR